MFFICIWLIHLYIWLPKTNADKIRQYSLHFRANQKKEKVSKNEIFTKHTYHSHLMPIRLLYRNNKFVRPPPPPPRKTSVLSTVPTESTACHDFIIIFCVYISTRAFSPSFSFFSMKGFAIQTVFVKLNSLKSLSVCHIPSFFYHTSLAII